MAEKRYTKNGEWARRDGGLWTVGLTASAAAELGDITFIEVPEVGRTVAAGEAVCAVEAVKAAADFYSPLGGRIVSFNPRIAAEPPLVNASPEDEAWFLTLDGVSEQEFESLLDEAGWKAWEQGR